MVIRLSSFHPLWALAPIIANRPLVKDWGCTYETVTVGKAKSTYPVRGGAGQVIQTPKLLKGSLLPEDIVALDDGRKGVIYVLVSTAYPILYVGISNGTLRDAVFGRGRLGHHLRKLFACHLSSTSHTQGWPLHAIQRYQDRVGAAGLIDCEEYRCPETMIGADLMIAVASLEHPWNPGDFEGTLLDIAHEAFTDAHPDLMVLNTGKVKRQPANIVLPANLGDVSDQLVNFRRQSKTERLSWILRNEIPLDINSVIRACTRRKSTDVSEWGLVVKSLSQQFSSLWDDRWYGQLTDMAEEWKNIELESAFVLEAAAISGDIPSKFVKEMQGIFDVYENSTSIMMSDFDGTGADLSDPIKEMRLTLMELDQARL
jgi:hypothetical protein